MFEPGTYRTRGGEIAVVTGKPVTLHWDHTKVPHSSRTKGTLTTIAGYLVESRLPVFWNVDGTHHIGGNVFPGTRDYDLVDRITHILGVEGAATPTS